LSIITSARRQQNRAAMRSVDHLQNKGTKSVKQRTIQETVFQRDYILASL